MGYFWGDDARLRLSIERSRDRELQLRDVADGHAARRHELDGADLHPDDTKVDLLLPPAAPRPLVLTA